MNIFSLAPGEDWILDRITTEFLSNTKHRVTDLEQADVILLFAPFIWNKVHESALEQKKLVIYLHHIVPNKFNYEEFEYRDKLVDAYIVPNRFTEYFVKQNTQKPVISITYWINEKLWKKENITKAHYNINENKFVIGSFQRDTEGNGISEGIYIPKLEKGPDIFLRVVKQLTKIKDILVLLAGWRRQWLTEQLKLDNIDFVYFERPSLEAINKLYEICDLYVASGRYEGGPQCITECAFKKIPIISTNCGIAPDILHYDCLYHSDDIEFNRIKLPKQRHIKTAYNNVKQLCSMQKQIKKIDDYLEQIFNKQIYIL